MKLATVSIDCRRSTAILDRDQARPLPEPDMVGLIRRLSDGGARPEPGGETVPLGAVKLIAPIPRPPRNVFCVGKNYHEHAKEFHDSGFDASAGASAVPDLPIIFTKAATTVIGPGEPIPGSADKTNSVDYEGELTVIIGKRARNVAKADAYN